MYDLLSIVPDTDLTMDFVKISSAEFTALDKQTQQPVGQIILKDDVIDASSDNVLTQYKLWITRPERAVGKPVDIHSNLGALIDAYEELLTGSYIMSRDNQIPFAQLLHRIKSSLEWLRSTDFYSAPASTIYHESFPGGLLVHSLKVYNQALELAKLTPFKDVDLADITLASLVHDWCKIGLYIPYEKNVKDETTGEWMKVAAYKREFKGLTLGHGTTSLYLASRCFNLKPEVAAAIRWHMGVYQCCEKEQPELFNCNDTYPIVLMLQFADNLSVTNFFK